MNMNMISVFLEAGAAVANPTFVQVWLPKLIIALVIGLLVGIIYAMSLKSKLTSVYSNDTAADYKRANSFKVEISKELFMYSKTEQKEKPKAPENK